MKKIKPNWGLEIFLKSSSQFFDTPMQDWRDILYKNHLIVFKNVHFTKEEYVKFGLYFGRPWDADNYAYSLEEAEAVTVEGKQYSLCPFSNHTSLLTKMQAFPWHADIPIYKGHEYPIRALWMIKSPNSQNSGITGFLKIDQEAWPFLAKEQKEQLESVELQYQSWHRPGTEIKFLPLVKYHPITKLPSLGLNHFKSETSQNPWIIDTRINGKLQNSCEFLEKCFEVLLREPSLQYYHIWDNNDLIIYDNNSFVHNRTALNFATTEERLIIRMNIDHIKSINR